MCRSSFKTEQDSPGHNFIVNFYNTVWITGSRAEDDKRKTGHHETYNKQLSDGKINLILNLNTWISHFFKKFTWDRVAQLEKPFHMQIGLSPPCNLTRSFSTMLWLCRLHPASWDLRPEPHAFRRVTHTSLAGRFLPSTIRKYRDVFWAILESSAVIIQYSSYVPMCGLLYTELSSSAATQFPSLHGTFSAWRRTALSPAARNTGARPHSDSDQIHNLIQIRFRSDPQPDPDQIQIRSTTWSSPVTGGASGTLWSTHAHAQTHARTHTHTHTHKYTHCAVNEWIITHVNVNMNKLPSHDLF